MIHYNCIDIESKYKYNQTVFSLVKKNTPKTIARILYLM